MALPLLMTMMPCHRDAIGRAGHGDAENVQQQRALHANELVQHF